MLEGKKVMVQKTVVQMDRSYSAKATVTTMTMTLPRPPNEHDHCDIFYAFFDTEVPKNTYNDRNQ